MAGLTMSDLRRREVIGLLGGAAAWPITAGAQQANILVIGYLSATSAEPDLLRGFHQGLKEGGAYVEGDNVAIDYRRADSRPDPCQRTRPTWFAGASP
jgi:putative ABC transport system substrate-binding protein